MPVTTATLRRLRQRARARFTDPAARRGLLVAFEGPDGSGKTTQRKLFRTWLDAEGYDVRQVESAHQLADASIDLDVDLLNFAEGLEGVNVVPQALETLHCLPPLPKRSFRPRGETFDPVPP